jgi:hypothetical protein
MLLEFVGKVVGGLESYVLMPVWLVLGTAVLLAALLTVVMLQRSADIHQPIEGSEVQPNAIPIVMVQLGAAQPSGAHRSRLWMTMKALVATWR